MNTYLQTFYNVMYKVLFDGFDKPTWFDPMRGLCSNYGDYLVHIGVFDIDIGLALYHQFIDAGINPTFPFWTEEDCTMYNDKKYSNPLRLQWIKDHRSKPNV
jgi:hypothetical protein